MLAEATRIVALYENESLPVEEIAALLGFESLAVKTVLAQYSRLYKEQSQDTGEDVTDGEYKELVDVVKNLARFSDQDHIKLASAKYLIDHKKGRLDRHKGPKKLTIGIMAINQELARTRQALQLANGPVVEAEVVNGSTNQTQQDEKAA